MIRRISSLLLAAWFAAALLLTPLLHTHGAGAECHGACGSHSHDSEPGRTDGPSLDKCPACQFATTTAVTPTVDTDPTPSIRIADPARQLLPAPEAAPSILLPPSRGPPRA
ncbi:MAG: hypothetical protein FJ221_03805 [Lentisphaerae bacterium]|nr:hypothetical protein [Lentisphaerota bacterium]